MPQPPPPSVVLDADGGEVRGRTLDLAVRDAERVELVLRGLQRVPDFVAREAQERDVVHVDRP
eukprot:9030827-Pyramimonas_sp.AAC.1